MAGDPEIHAGFPAPAELLAGRGLTAFAVRI